MATPSAESYKAIYRDQVQPVMPPSDVPTPETPGNLDPWNRPVWGHPNRFATESGGTYGTTNSISITDENPQSPRFGLEVLIPTVIDGYPFSEADARQHYANTGEHLGAFPGGQYDRADKFATWLHEEQARRINAAGGWEAVKARGGRLR